MRAEPATLNTMRRDSESGTTFIEISMMSLIFTIAVIAIATAIRTATKGVLMAKEQSRAMALARDQLEVVKNMGYKVLENRFSNYYYPDDPDPATPLYQKKSAIPYPAIKPNALEDPWTAEVILMGGVKYWRHVVVKFVQEDANGKLIQNPEPCPSCATPEPGGGNSAPGLAFIEVDVTWLNRRTGRMAQVRVSSLLANTSVASTASGRINGHVIDDGTGLGAPAPLPVGGSPTYILSGLVITAQNEQTLAIYTVMSDSSGSYHLKNLPNGSYTVKLSGVPAYQDSAYTAWNKGLYAAAGQTVSINDTAQTLNGIDLYTIQLKKVSVRMKVQDVLLGQVLKISVSDGVSADQLWTAPADCTAGSPCSLMIPNVAVPYTGSKTYQLRVENQTAPSVATAQLCVDSSVAAGGVYYVGWGSAPPPPPNPCNPMACPGFVNCVDPDPEGPPLSFTTTGMTVANIGVRVRVIECVNFSCGLPTTPALVRVSYTGKTSGLGATLTVDANGVATFTGVPPESSQNLVVRAWMTVTGYSTDEYPVPVNLVSGQNYDLDENNGSTYSAEPPAGARHTLVLLQTSAISGTIWKGGGLPFPHAVVRISSAKSEWTTIVTADDSGRFKYGVVPVATDAYTVAPVVGADYSSTPGSRSVYVAAKGTEYRIDNSKAPMDFVVLSINGMLRGTVSYGGEPLRTGAVVVACSSPFVDPFPSSLPSPALAGHYTYSTVTLTDGTYAMRVVAGLVDYYIYAFAVKDGVPHVYSSSPTQVTVPPDVDAVHDFSLP
ncbi:MAG: carboxypeptidase-like regulatory domain-containing protein [Candidatus Coatesbacteria bacterium]